MPISCGNQQYLAGGAAAKVVAPDDDGVLRLELAGLHCCVWCVCRCVGWDGGGVMVYMHTHTSIHNTMISFFQHTIYMHVKKRTVARGVLLVGEPDEGVGPQLLILVDLFCACIGGWVVGLGLVSGLQSCPSRSPFPHTHPAPIPQTQPISQKNKSPWTAPASDTRRG